MLQLHPNSVRLVPHSTGDIFITTLYRISSFNSNVGKLLELYKFLTKTSNYFIIPSKDNRNLLTASIVSKIIPMVCILSTMLGYAIKVLSTFIQNISINANSLQNV